LKLINSKIMKISILTLGCKVNQAESSLIGGALESSGHKIVNISEGPDICIINTCTVTSKSDYQSRQLIRRAHRVGARVIVTGCYSELNKEDVHGMEGVEDIIGNANKLNIINKLTGNSADMSLYFPRHERSRFFIKMQDGCNYSCSYCTIPKARGASKSVNPEMVIQQVNGAVSSGYNEIVLTGIHLGTYGYDLEHKVTLSNILKTILNKTKIKRVRLSSLEVLEIDDELLDLFINERICKHLHIPLQSGDDKILKLMNRAYDTKQFSARIEQIHKNIPEINIGTDVIVGFPGEGDPEFENTYKFLEDLPIVYMHIFPFSPRPGTIASKMPDNTPSALKKERVLAIEALNKRKKIDYMLKQFGKTLDVLVESSGNDDRCCGTSGNYLKILLPSNNCPCGSIIYARIEVIKEGRLFGTPIL